MNEPRESWTYEPFSKPTTGMKEGQMQMHGSVTIVAFCKLAWERITCIDYADETIAKNAPGMSERLERMILRQDLEKL